MTLRRNIVFYVPLYLLLAIDLFSEVVYFIH